MTHEDAPDVLRGGGWDRLGGQALDKPLDHDANTLHAPVCPGMTCGPHSVQSALPVQVGLWHMGQLVRNNPGKRRDYLSSYIERDGCWIYTGSINNQGYGTILGRGAHRYFYEHMVGTIPPDLTIDHLCRVTACVNPEHLEPVTAAENTARKGQRPGHCREGHPIPGKNYALLERGNPAYPCTRCDEYKRHLDDPNDPSNRFIRLVQTNLLRRDQGLPLYNMATLPDA